MVYAHVYEPELVGYLSSNDQKCKQRTMNWKELGNILFIDYGNHFLRTETFMTSKILMGLYNAK